MSNFTYSPFVHPQHGEFTSVEGYWYWLSTGHNALRNMHGYAAKKFGRKLRGSDVSLEDNMFMNFKDCIRTALRAKLESNDRLRELLKESTLPFVHYYVMDGKVIPQDKDGWIMEHWEVLRKELQNGN
jgi:hypothetical protein